MLARRFSHGNILLRFVIIYFLTSLIFIRPIFCDDKPFSTPEKAFACYRQALATRNTEAADRCYTKESLIRCGKHKSSRMKRLYKIIKNRPFRFEHYGNRAIVRWLVPHPSLPSYYLIESHDAWEIDAAFTCANIQIDATGQWRWKDNNARLESLWKKGLYP